MTQDPLQGRDAPLISLIESFIPGIDVVRAAPPASPESPVAAMERAVCRGQRSGPHEIIAMMAPYGGVVLLDGHFPSDAFLAHASVRPVARGFLPGRPRNCHGNAHAFAQTDPECIHFTGLARTGAFWLCHSWVERAGQTLETTPVARDAYVGFDITLVP